MAKKKTKQTKVKSKVKKDKKLKLGTFKETAREKLIGQHIGYRYDCLLYTSPSPRDLSTSRMPSSA